MRFLLKVIEHVARLVASALLLCTLLVMALFPRFGGPVSGEIIGQAFVLSPFFGTVILWSVLIFLLALSSGTLFALTPARDNSEEG